MGNNYTKLNINMSLNTQTVNKIEQIEGHLSRNEGLFLHSLISHNVKDPSIVEIGSWQGRSTAWLSTALQNENSNGQVYAVDHGIGDPEAGILNTKDIFVNNMKRLSLDKYVTHIFKRSEDALTEWTKDINILFIDGGHDYVDVKKDIQWEKYLVEGGLIAFHDVLNPAEGPVRIVIERIINSSNFSDFGTADSIFFARKITKGKKQRKIQRKILTFLLRMSLWLTLKDRTISKRSYKKRLIRIIMKRSLRRCISLITRPWDRIKRSQIKS